MYGGRLGRRNQYEVIIGDNASKRGGMNPLYSIFIRMVMCCGCFFGICIMIWTFWNLDDITIKPVPIGDENTPLVVLYHGKPDEAPYEWNTGVWPSWGRR